MNYIFGASFNPEHWLFRRDEKLAQKAFSILINELGIKDLRLAIRSSDVLKNKRIDISYYNYFIKTAITKNVRICLNVGPIKTMRWPEETISQEILQQLTHIPEHGAVLYKNSELAKLSLNYLHDLLKVIKNEYGNVFSSFQANNENFNKFGQYGWTMDTEFEKQCIEMINQHFPDKSIMINSSGLDDVKKILNLIKTLETSQFIIGINYYYRTPGIDPLRFLFPNRDNLDTKKLGSLSMKKLVHIVNQEHIPLEISEFQNEPWDGLDGPGDDYAEIKQRIKKIQKITRNLEQDNFVIRLWGIEYLINKILKNEITSDHQKMINHIQSQHV